MTFSIAAQCPRTGASGIVVSSSSICVAARCAFARAAAGAVASQNITNPELGLRGLDLLSQGNSAAETLEQLLTEEPHPSFRQLTVVDRDGTVACHSGEKTLGVHAHATGKGCVAAGNLLDNDDVPAAMVAAFESTPDDELADRLLRALQAGRDAGGEAGNVQSAGMLVASQVSWPVVDLRVDWDDTPISRLAEIWRLYQPQMDDYVTRALDPGSAPAYGVPGDP